MRRRDFLRVLPLAAAGAAIAPAVLQETPTAFGHIAIDPAVKGGSYTVVCGNPGPIDGLRPSYVVLDEVSTVDEKRLFELSRKLAEAGRRRLDELVVLTTR